MVTDRNLSPSDKTNDTELSGWGFVSQLGSVAVTRANLPACLAVRQPQL